MNTKTRPFHLFTIAFLKGSIKTNKRIKIPNIQNISNVKTIGFTFIGFIILVNPKIAIILKIFEPIIFPIKISNSFLIAAEIDAASSGRLVPRAITETEIIRSSTPILKAILEAPLTKNSAPYTNPIDAKITNKKDTNRVTFGLTVSKPFFLFSFLDE